MFSLKGTSLLLPLCHCRCQLLFPHMIDTGTPLTFLKPSCSWPRILGVMSLYVQVTCLYVCLKFIKDLRLKSCMS